MGRGGGGEGGQKYQTAGLAQLFPECVLKWQLLWEKLLLPVDTWGLQVVMDQSVLSSLQCSYTAYLPSAHLLPLFRLTKAGL